MYVYNLIAIAGTFDRLHKGHQYFISQAFKLGEKVIIGLTSDRYTGRKSQIRNPKFQINPKFKITEYQIQKKESGQYTSGVAGIQGFPRGGGVRINNYNVRKKELEDFLKEEGLLKRVEIVKIDDVYGPAGRRASRIKNGDIEALAVTSETLEGGKLVNKKRKELGLRPLKILKLPMVKAEDKKRIASSRIRLGEIDRWGRAFAKQMQISNLKSQISNELRNKLKKPQGLLIRGDSGNLEKIVPELKNLVAKLKPVMIITVGDEVTKVCNNAGIIPNLAIFDFKVNRIKKYWLLQDLAFTEPFARAALNNGVVTVKNPAGHIANSLVRAVNKALRNIIQVGEKRLIKINGEDDLGAVPAILLSPLGSVVIYGQPGEGVVMVEVTEEKKQTLLDLLKI